MDRIDSMSIGLVCELAKSGADINLYAIQGPLMQVSSEVSHLRAIDDVFASAVCDLTTAVIQTKAIASVDGLVEFLKGFSAIAPKFRDEPSDPSAKPIPDLRPVSLTGQLPAVPIRKSVTNEYIICLEDGVKRKMLRRHLGTVHGMTPEQYRTKWGLPADYPMTAPNYSKQKSNYAHSVNFGSFSTVYRKTPRGRRATLATAA